jgi:ribosome-associated protein
MIYVNENISLAEDEIEEHFVRSPGSGGQKVNKTATAVQLRFDARHSRDLSNAVFLRLKSMAGQRMTKEGVIVISAHSFATQERNRQDAQDRLVELIRKAAVPPKTRRKTKPSKASKERRLDSKRQKSNLKKGRGRLRQLD